jgi:hypothetical protein
MLAVGNAPGVVGNQDWRVKQMPEEAIDPSVSDMKSLLAPDQEIYDKLKEETIINRNLTKASIS